LIKKCKASLRPEFHQWKQDLRDGPEMHVEYVVDRRDWQPVRSQTGQGPVEDCTHHRAGNEPYFDPDITTHTLATISLLPYNKHSVTCSY